MIVCKPGLQLPNEIHRDSERLGTRSLSIARPDTGFGHMEETIVDVGTGCMRPLIRELFVSGDGWGCIKLKPPSLRRLAVQRHSKKGQRCIGRPVSTGFGSHRTRFNMNYSGTPSHTLDRNLRSNCRQLIEGKYNRSLDVKNERSSRS